MTTALFSIFEQQVLVDELDYLPDEVDDMDPQIAAVVIEKSLPRPRAGNGRTGTPKYTYSYRQPCVNPPIFGCALPPQASQHTKARTHGFRTAVLFSAPRRVHPTFAFCLETVCSYAYAYVGFFFRAASQRWRPQRERRPLVGGGAGGFAGEVGLMATKLLW